MPVIKSAKKRMRQNVVRRARNFPVRSEMKTLFKKVLMLVKDGNLEEAKKMLPLASSVLDTAVKKGIIHDNNASRKKSRLQREINKLEQDGGKKKTVETKKGSKAKETKKEEVKKEEPKAQEEAEDKKED